jgi:hypothetical protein
MSYRAMARSILIAALAEPVLGFAASPSGQDVSERTPMIPVSESQGREALFGDDVPEPASAEARGQWQGYVQGEAARAYRDPAHWSKARLRAEIGREGRWSGRLKWKISARLDYDAAYDVSHHYPPAVRADQRSEFMLRETYVDVSEGDWNVRLGRQHIVWGEMVGTFVADVVSAKDMREFVLPEFGQLRIPQWAARTEYFKNDFHAEFVWIPVPSFDRIGKPGADFYPAPLPVVADYLGEQLPTRKLSNSNYGLRISQLARGWDVSGFYYRSLDASPTFYRVSSAGAPFVFQPRHDRIDQAGGTVTKDIGGVVLKGELVYTKGRQFNVTRLTAANGLVRQNTLDYALGLDLSLGRDTRLNVQFLQRAFFGHDPDTVTDARESAASLLLSHQLTARLEAEALAIRSLNRDDWMLRPQLNWTFEKNWLLKLGVDIFSGPPTGLFGRFDNNDRAYVLVRRAF